MCLTNFIEFKQISQDNPVIGYRDWQVYLDNPTILRSMYVDYKWEKDIEGPHEVLEKDSGIYSYNNYNYNYPYYRDRNYCNNRYNNNNYNCNYYYYNNHYYYYYNICGIIFQWGKVAIHREGYRSEYAQVKKLFTIRESDAEGPKKFLVWIKLYNEIVNKLAPGKTMHFQDFIESMKENKNG